MKVRGMEKTCYTSGYPFVRELKDGLSTLHILSESIIQRQILRCLSYFSDPLFKQSFYVITAVTRVLRCVFYCMRMPFILAFHILTQYALKYHGLACINHASHILWPANRAEETTRKQTPASPPGHDMNGLGFDQGQRGWSGWPKQGVTVYKVGGLKGHVYLPDANPRLNPYVPPNSEPQKDLIGMKQRITKPIHVN